MQRVKGHGNQGGVRNGTDNEHENVNNWAHQNYNGANPGMAAGAYSVAAYYGTAYYRTYCMGDGTNTWPNNDQVTYVSNYNGQLPPEAAAAYPMDGVYSAAPYSGPYNQTAVPNAPLNYYPNTAAEYPTWNAGTPMPPVPGKPYDEYYREGAYNGVDSLKSVDQRLQSLDIASDSNPHKMPDPKFSYGLGRSDTYSSTTSASNEKKTTWASIAKQPAKPIPQTSSGSSKKKGPGMPPPPMVPGRHNIDLNTWEPKNNSVPKAPVAQAPPPPSSANSLAAKPVWNGPVIISETPPPEISSHCEPVVNSAPPTPSYSSTSMPMPIPTPSPPHSHKPFSNAPPMNRPPPPPPVQAVTTTMYQQPPMTRAPPITTVSSEVITTSSSLSSSVSNSPPHSVVDKLKDKNNYNPSELELPPVGTRFFVIKSYSEDDVHRSIKYEIWCSTEHGNKRLDDAFADQKSTNGAVYLFFSVNGSGHFCGVAQMMSPVDYGASSSVWAQDKWKGQFRVRWIYVKDVPNSQLRHIRLENNENKPVTNSRDTQEVPYDKGIGVLKTIHAFSHTTSIFDDFTHYEKRQEEGDSNKRGPIPHQGPPMHHNHSAPQHRNNPFESRSMQNKDRDGGGNNYSQMNYRRSGMRNNGNGFNNQKNQSNALRS